MPTPSDSPNRSGVLSTIILGTSLIISLASLGYSISRSAVTLRPTSKSIQVRGVAEKTVAADKATLTLSITVNGGTVKGFKEKVRWVKQEIERFVQTHGIKMSDWDIDPIRAPSSTYLPEHMLKLNPDHSLGVSFSMTLKSGKYPMALLEKIHNEAANLMQDEELVSCNSRIDYEYSKFVQERPELIRQAAEDARAAASLVAKDMQVPLGRVESISQGLVEMAGQREITLRVVLQTAWQIGR